MEKKKLVSNKRNNSKIIIIAVLALLMSTSIAFVPNVRAHSPPWQIPNYAFLNVAPNPAGVGQTVTVGMWLGQVPPTALAQYGDRWMNFKVTVTKPDGTQETLGPFTSDDTGGTATIYTPTEVGNYTFVFNFPGQTLAGANPEPFSAPNPFVGDYYEPATSNTVTLTVQQSPVPSIPQTALPTNYWSRPIESVNDQWYTVSGNWLGLGASSFAATGLYNGTGNYNPYTTAPTASHIIWTKPEAWGGLVGGEFGGTSTSNFYSTSQYEPKFAPVIMNGILYYEVYPGASTNPAGWNAVNLQTGQTVWSKNTADTLTCGQLLDYVSPNQYGSFGYLWSSGTVPSGDTTIAAAIFTGVGTVYVPGSPIFTTTGTTWNMYDAQTGNYILSIVNGTSMTLTEEANGDLIGYYVNSPNPNAPTINCWNSTQAILYPTGQPPGYSNWVWRPPQNMVIPFSAGIMWSIPLPTNINGVPFPSILSFSNSILSPSSINSGVILLTSESLGGGAIEGIPFYNAGFQIEAGFSAATGQSLWIVNRTETPYTRLQLIGIGDGVYSIVNLETSTLSGYSLDSGAQVWTTDLANANAYDSIGGFWATLANDVLYLWGFGGDIWAINMSTGSIIWQTTTTQLVGSAGENTPYGTWPLWTFSVGTVADGVLFVPEGHMYSPPLFRGAQQLAINITNGQLIWSILSFDVTSGPAISDGIMTTFNAYDNQIYGYGMGPSKTTISAPQVGVTTATPITITGSVTDISTGASQQAVAANFPNGLPCVSDASMSAFMEAVYMQQPMPSNITGVPVTLSVLDSNGNYRAIGTSTTNAQGEYGFTWIPDISGNYTLYATFAGTDAYYASSASTYFYASSPSATSVPTATPVTGLASNTTVMYGIVAIIIVIVIIGAAIMLMLSRKRP